jgi:hypothetical protein
MDVLETLAHESTEVLEPNLQFYRQSPDDSKRHFVGPEILKTLAWVATTLVLPLVLTAGNEFIKDRIKRWLDKDKKTDLPAPISEQELAGIRQQLSRPEASPISKEGKQDAERVVAQFLAFHGWPASMAKMDATAIVSNVVMRITQR